MVEWLSQESGQRVSVAKEGERPAIGRVLVAGVAGHLTLKTPERLGYTDEPRHYAYRPSVDVFFQSVSRLWRGRRRRRAADRNGTGRCAGTQGAS